MIVQQYFALFLHHGVLFVDPREEHLMMVLFSSYRWYPKYRVVPETSGLPKISGNTRCFGLPATRWFSKLNRVGRVSKEIPGSGSGSGSRWALPPEPAASQVSVSHPKHQQALSLPPLPPSLSFPLQSPTLGSPWAVTTCPSDIRNLAFGRFLQKQEATRPNLHPLSKPNISDLSKCHVAIMIAHDNQFCQ